MEQWMESVTSYVLDAWRNATAAQYVHVVLAIVLVGWSVRRFRGD
ncbi:MAG TPA: hypothetical protein VML55_17545 [Planctomycetaceae bacterium]|nr:hypothetical protein [Planctomycetaceae bacterium]